MPSADQVPVNNPHSIMQLKRKAEVEKRLSDLATRQHGVVAARQLVALGFSPRAVGRRVENGRLARLYRGVYAVGHRDLNRDGRWMAAVLASGPGALLSHRTAAHARGFTSRSPATVEVVTPRQVRPRRGIHARMDSGLTAADADIADGIPCLSVARTLLTLAAGAAAGPRRRGGTGGEAARASPRRCRGATRAGARAARERASAHCPRRPDARVNMDPDRAVTAVSRAMSRCRPPAPSGQRLDLPAGEWVRGRFLLV